MVSHPSELLPPPSTTADGPTTSRKLLLPIFPGSKSLRRPRARMPRRYYELVLDDGAVCQLLVLLPWRRFGFGFVGCVEPFMSSILWDFRVDVRVVCVLQILYKCQCVSVSDQRYLPR